MNSNQPKKTWRERLEDGEIGPTDLFCDVEGQEGIDDRADDAFGEPVPFVDPEGGLLW